MMNIRHSVVTLLTKQRTAFTAIIAAIVWDYDRTLVDACRKNLGVTRAIIRVDKLILQHILTVQVYAHALAQSANWHEFYKMEFDFSDADTDDAGKMDGIPDA
jgi:hypothetical protein